MGFVANLFNTPKPPNPRDVAEAQGEVSRETALLNAALNRVNQSGPFGSLTYNQTGTDAQGNPTFSATTTLTPEQQAILNQLQANQIGLGSTAANLIGNTQDLYGNPIDLPDVPDFFTGATPVVNEMLSRHDAFMDPYRTAEVERLDNQLRNQGLVPGTPGYDRQMRTLLQTQAQAQGQFLNTAQNQAFTQQHTQHLARMEEALKEYGLPLESIKAIMGLTGAPTSPTFPTVPTATAQTPDITKAFMDQFNALNTQYQQGWGALGNIGSAIMGLPVGTAAPTTVGGSVGAGLSSLLGLV